MYIPIDVDCAVKKECKRRRYSDKTIKTYLYYIHNFLNWSKKDLGKISKKDVKAYLQRMDNQGKSGNTLNVAHMAIKFLFEDVMERRMWIDIKYSKVPKKIQRFLDKNETRKFIDSIKNPKHALMICLMYSAGLRVSELINLKKEDLKIEQGFGYVRNGKGGKDRLFVITPIFRNILKRICFKKNDSEHLFISGRGGKYSVRSMQLVVKKAAKKACLKDVHPHTLRHSFANQLIENGLDLCGLQAVLGHKSPETSMIYVHSNSPKLIKLQSPIETL